MRTTFRGRACRSWSRRRALFETFRSERSKLRIDRNSSIYAVTRRRDRHHTTCPVCVASLLFFTFSYRPWRCAPGPVFETTFSTDGALRDAFRTTSALVVPVSSFRHRIQRATRVDFPFQSLQRFVRRFSRHISHDTMKFGKIERHHGDGTSPTDCFLLVPSTPRHDENLRRLPFQLYPQTRSTNEIETDRSTSRSYTRSLRSTRTTTSLSKRGDGI